ncbi:DUF4214 domain-containing protein [Sulfitobacter sp. M57]|uniref:DUF4214 domain-containing protein n=1 Tax=unclassified Sulfitobacter TaxID=196795 RepID=UPI0023E2B3C1|nr:MULTISPECIES: DUF4214 domain-containing protein [unclassified Sulfitobacter]MDF3415947.1 DUF4214 domain-containing protein [Sulfitobacter sp. KE5]MDF3423427.1 DUF4214 domain-containing protein [Sulfitobacter sp. KE43]MDF3434493.1 DUF4214 domain-containing protein [Sulfitobacter sp. KE42]MDF3460133.1 DUF4214 domain-containing protein [Sulfitobacter sp. S74]MDF3464031.1 DUF4214 domain-containing protein [Sulfitobacter sp. Ks18]
MPTYTLSDNDDNFTGSETADVIRGRGGNDMIDARFGDDFVRGGAGNDTIYGRDQNDTLYGDSGQDSLIGGLGNDTLYGGTGDDLLAGSQGDDEIHGGNGNDLVFLGVFEGSDRIFMDAGNDTLDGAAADSSFFASGGSGDDELRSGHANDTLDGGTGDDWAMLSNSMNHYTLTLQPGDLTLTDRSAGGTGTDTLISIENLEFATGGEDTPNTVFALGTYGGMANLTADQIESFVEFYIAYFNRAPDAVGLNFWGTAFANGTTLEQMASLFIDQPETRATYPSSMSNADFATTVYDNVLGRVADQGGFDFWVGVLDDGSVGRDQFIREILAGVRAEPPQGASPAFIAQQQADENFLESKVDIGAYFAIHKGMSDVSDASAAMALFDGSAASLNRAVDAIDDYHQDALGADGGFLLPLVGVLDDPFSA